MSQHSTGGRRINKIPLPALPYPNIRQKQRSDVYSSVFYLWQMTGSQGKGGTPEAHWCPGWLRSPSKALPWGEQQPSARPGRWRARAHVPGRWRARAHVPEKPQDCARLLREETGSQQQGKTREVKLEGEVLYRSGHSVNGVIDLVFVWIQSFSSIHVIP